LATTEWLTRMMFRKPDEYFSGTKELYMPCVKNKNEVIKKDQLLTKTRLFQNFNSNMVFWAQFYNNAFEQLLPTLMNPKQVQGLPATVLYELTYTEDDERVWTAVPHKHLPVRVFMKNRPVYTIDNDLIPCVFNSWLSHFAPT